MVHSVLTGGLFGVEGYPIEVEVDVSEGLPCIDMVGYLGAEVREASDRVRVALKNSGYNIPSKRITVNLSPANKKKDGTAFDLPIALAVLMGMGVVTRPEEKILVLGELGLDGNVKKVPGVLPILLMAKEQGIHTCMVPLENQKEGMCIKGMHIFGVKDLKEALDGYQNIGAWQKRQEMSEENISFDNAPDVDFADIVGQTVAKRAAEIAAAGFHNLLLYGPPGTGKTMIAAAMPGILPPMNEREMMETSKVYSVSGLLGEENGMIKKRPFLNPHHTITPGALVGGGANPMPGVISKANHGVLFLDELPEFKRQTLDLLRQPMEEGRITIVRKSGSYVYPCNFMLVAAMNPCPCGYYPDRNRCNCNDKEVLRYVKGISGPLLNRIDMSVAVSRNTYRQIKSEKVKSESTQEIRKRVEVARQMQNLRNGDGIFNSQIPARELKYKCFLTAKAEKTIELYFTDKQLSMRGYHRLLRVARTIADLEQCKNVDEEHVLEAVSYRGMLDK